MTYRSFTLEIADKVAHLRLNRPEKLNALDGVFWQELDAILAQLQRDARGDQKLAFGRQENSANDHLT